MAAGELPPLVLLRAFDAAGRHRSFARAAAALHVTPSTISHQIADLERHLGVALFLRSGSRLALTAEGEALLADVAVAFERLRAAGSRLRRGGQPSTLRISANPFFAGEVLVPLLAGLEREFPGLALHVRSTEVLDDPRDLAVDFCIRTGGGELPGLERHPIHPVSVVPVASPRRGEARAARIDFAYHGESAWSRYEQLGGTRLPATGPGRFFSSHHTAVRAAAEGLGTTLGMLPVIAPWLRARRLRVIARTKAVPLGTLDLVSRPLAPSERVLRRAREWLITAIRESARD